MPPGMSVPLVPRQHWDYGPDESYADLWLERSNFSGLVLGAVAYGTHIAVFASTIYFMARAAPDVRATKLSKFSIAFVCVLFTLGTLMLAGNTKFSEMMWIDDRTIPGGPNAWFGDHFDTPVMTMVNSSYIIANFLANGVLFHRLLAVWSYNYFIAVIPFLAFVASSILSALTVFQSAKPDAGLRTSLTMQFALPWCIMAVAVNTSITSLIVLRLLLLRRSVVRVLGKTHSSMYISISAMVIESAALYSLTNLLYIAFYVRDASAMNLVLPVLSQVMCIAPELIILRVSMGHAWSRDTNMRIGVNTHRMALPTMVFPTLTFDSDATTSHLSKGLGSSHSVDDEAAGNDKIAEAI